MNPVHQVYLFSELGIAEAELNEAVDPARMCAPYARMVGG